MGKNKAVPQPLTSEDLQSRREATERVSEYLYNTTVVYLKALLPTLLPHRLFGKHIEHPGNRSVSGEDKAWNGLLAAYRDVAKKPYRISEQLDSPLAPIPPAVVLHRWEYRQTFNSASKHEGITIVCPFKWIVSFQSSLNATEFRQAMVTDPSGKRERIQEFVVRALVMGEMLGNVPGIQELFSALRLKLAKETTPETGALPLCTLTSTVASQLPSDDVVLQTTQLAGVPRFIELIERDSITNLADPLKEKLLSVI
jgi:hypothetical protein